jgi:hypothetical protein
MRGDSIRDLYAKTLALLGLGVLAGTGALVDYWPSGVRLPAVQSGLAQPELMLALAVPDPELQSIVSVPPAPSSERRRLVVHPSIERSAVIPEFVVPEPFESIDGDVIQTASLSRPAALVPVAFADRDYAGPLGEEVALSEPVPSFDWPQSPLPLSSAPVALAAADNHGVLAGVVKVTKSSLVLTGRKTGASIVGAFRAVSGAVKKALPN